jgi:hypothetical protein
MYVNTQDLRKKVASLNSYTTFTPWLQKVLTAEITKMQIFQLFIERWQSNLMKICSCSKDINLHYIISKTINLNCGVNVRS